MYSSYKFIHDFDLTLYMKEYYNSVYVTFLHATMAIHICADTNKPCCKRLLSYLKFSCIFGFIASVYKQHAYMSIDIQFTSLCS